MNTVNYIKIDESRLVISTYIYTDEINKLKIPKAKITKTGIINSTMPGEETYMEVFKTQSIPITNITPLTEFLDTLNGNDIVYAVSDATKVIIVKNALNSKYDFFKKFLPVSVDFIVSLMEELSNIDMPELTPLDLNKFMKSSYAINPLLDFKNLFAYKDMPENTYYSYSRKETAKKKDDDDSLDISKTRLVLGKKNSTNIYTVTKLVKPDTRIDKLYAKFREMTKISYYTILLLNKIISSKGIYYTDANKLNYITDRPFRLETPSKDILVSELFPPSIAMYAFEKFNEMNEYLNEVLNFPITNEHTLATKSSIDITELIFDVENKHAIRHLSEFSIMYDYKLNGNTYKVPVVSSLDLPSRNKLKRLEKQKPRVLLTIINEADISARVYTMVILNTGDGMITANYPANLILLENK